jgi:hypothetical protein
MRNLRGSRRWFEAGNRGISKIECRRQAAPDQAGPSESRCLAKKIAARPLPPISNSRQSWKIEQDKPESFREQKQESDPKKEPAVKVTMLPDYLLEEEDYAARAAGRLAVMPRAEDEDDLEEEDELDDDEDDLDDDLEDEEDDEEDEDEDEEDDEDFDDDWEEVDDEDELDEDEDEDDEDDEEDEDDDWDDDDEEEEEEEEEGP